jgi:Zn-finger nucleic acid-binding protein
MAKYPLIKTAKIQKSMLGGYVAVYPCPYCKKELTSKEKEIGEPDSCPHCGGIFTFDESISDEIQEWKAKTLEEKQKKEREKEQSSQRRQLKNKERMRSVIKFLNQPVLSPASILKYLTRIAGEKPTETRTTTCPYCKETIIAGAMKCKHCGEYLEDKSKITNQKTSGQKTAESVMGIGCAILLIMLCSGILLDSGRSHSSRNSYSSVSSRTRPSEHWKSGGTLHTKTALDWQNADRHNKLATCADFVAGMWKEGKLTRKIASRINNVDDVLPFANELADNLDAAFEPQPDPGENRRIFANQTVSGTAAILMIQLGWLKVE